MRSRIIKDTEEKDPPSFSIIIFPSPEMKSLEQVRGMMGDVSEMMTSQKDGLASHDESSNALARSL